MHAVSDWTESFQCLEFNRKAYHVGNGNSLCIGLEICEAKTADQFKRGIEIAAETAALMLIATGLMPGDMRTHHWFTINYGGSDHIDPDPYFTKWGYTWDMFVNKVKEAYHMDAQAIAKAVWDYRVSGSITAAKAVAEAVRTDDVTGRGKKINDHDHIKWIAAEVAGIKEQNAEILKLLREGEDK